MDRWTNLLFFCGRSGRQTSQWTWLWLEPSYFFLSKKKHTFFWWQSFDWLTIFYVGGSRREEAGGPFNEFGFDWSEGEGGWLLRCLYRLVSSLSLSLSFQQCFTFQMTLSHFLSHPPYRCHRFLKTDLSTFNLKTPDILFNIIWFSGIASIGLMNHKHGFFFWLSCFSWVWALDSLIEFKDWAVLSFRSCLGSGQNLWQKRGPTTKCHPWQFLPWHIQDQSWHQCQPSLWSGF